MLANSVIRKEAVEHLKPMDRLVGGLVAEGISWLLGQTSWGCWPSEIRTRVSGNMVEGFGGAEDG